MHVLGRLLLAAYVYHVRRNDDLRCPNLITRLFCALKNAVHLVNQLLFQLFTDWVAFADGTANQGHVVFPRMQRAIPQNPRRITIVASHLPAFWRIPARLVITPFSRSIPSQHP